MPEISRITDSLSIYMHYNEGSHHRPHFHVIDGDDEASIAIDTRKIIVGYLERSTLRFVRRWAMRHQAELLANWERARDGQELLHIEER